MNRSTEGSSRPRPGFFIGILLTACFTTAAWGGPLQGRLEKQGERIEQGDGSGALTDHEEKVLENQQKVIRAERNAALADDGKISGREARRVTRHQNHASRRIHRLKHNNRVD